MLDHLDAKGGQLWQHAFKQVACPGLVCIDSNSRGRALFAYPSHDTYVSFAVALELEELEVSRIARFAPCVRLAAQAECENRGELMEAQYSLPLIQ